jgi:hypothetical protein
MALLGHVDQITPKKISGWAIDADKLGMSVEVRIIVNGREAGRCIAEKARKGLANYLKMETTDHHGFEFTFDPELPSTHKMTVEVLMAETNFRIERGYTTLHPRAMKPEQLVPIIVTSRGRSGTTLLMRWLRDHPDVIVADTYPFEFELSRYYATVTNVLTSYKIESTKAEPDFVQHALEKQLIGRNPWNNPSLLAAVGGTELEALFSVSLPNRLSGVFKSVIVDAYNAIGRSTGKKFPRFFAEKSSLESDTRHGIRELLGSVREIVLVRDPRDFLCSAKAYWHFDSERALIDLRRVLPIYLQILDQLSEDTIIVKYEDLVGNRETTLTRISSHVGLSAPVEGASGTDLFGVHATSKTQESSVGRWRADLTDDELQRCLSLSGDFMDAFGYN